MTYKELVANDEIWDTFLDKFNEESAKRMSYTSRSDEAINEIENEIKNKQLIVEDSNNADIEA